MFFKNSMEISIIFKLLFLWGDVVFLFFIKVLFSGRKPLGWTAAGWGRLVSLHPHPRIRWAMLCLGGAHFLACACFLDGLRGHQRVGKSHSEEQRVIHPLRGGPARRCSERLLGGPEVLPV